MPIILDIISIDIMLWKLLIFSMDLKEPMTFSMGSKLKENPYFPIQVRPDLIRSRDIFQKFSLDLNQILIYFRSDSYYFNK